MTEIPPTGIIKTVKGGSNKNKEKLSRRLKIITGQIRGLQKMLEEDRYCIDILYQTMAIKEALSSLEDLILKNHLSTHVVEQIKSGRISKAVNEMLSVYRLSKKKK